MRTFVAALVAVLGLHLAGLSLAKTHSEKDLGLPAQSTVAAVDYDPLVTRPNEEGDTGELVYRRYCAGCHGLLGDGKGPGAASLRPRPRDFTQGVFKFTTTPGGAPPIDEDILRTITEGLHGTSMPSWRLLPLNERRSVVRYVKSFCKEWDLRDPQPPVPYHENPFDMLSVQGINDAIAKGRETYHKAASCWSCHPSYVDEPELKSLVGFARSDLEHAIAKPDLWGESILPPDFKTDRLKSVRDLADLYHVILAGVGGTAMPTWKSALTAEQAWGLVLYVDSLRPAPWSVTQRMKQKLAEAASK